MAISVNQAVQFCDIFRTSSLFEHGQFKKGPIINLSQEERKICVTALNTIENFQHFLEESDPKSQHPTKKWIETKKLNEITDKILQTPLEAKGDKVPWYKAPFVWIAKTVNSLFLWFQNTFMGRVSSQELLNKIASYCQDANNAPSEIKKIEEEILPKVHEIIQKKTIEKNESVLLGELANGLLEIYKILLALKSEGKREQIMEKAISFSHVDGIDDPKVSPFYKIVHDFLSPYFSGEFENTFALAPYMELNQAALEIDEIKSEIFKQKSIIGSTDNQVKIATKSVQEAILERDKAKQEAEEFSKKIDEAYKKYLAANEQAKKASEKVLTEDTKENKQQVTLLNSQVIQIKAEYETLVQQNSGFVEKIEKWNKEVTLREEKVDKLDKQLEEEKEELDQLKKQLNQSSLQLKVHFFAIQGIMRPLLVSDKAKKVKEILYGLYQAASNCMALSDSVKKAQMKVVEKNTEKDAEELKKLRCQLEAEIDKVARLFEFSYRTIEEKINLQSLKLVELKYAGINDKKFDKSEIGKYGLERLIKFRDDQIEKVELLKFKYKIQAH